MHLGMLEAIEIRMEIVSGNFRCLSISNCGFLAPDIAIPKPPQPEMERTRAARDAASSLRCALGGLRRVALSDGAAARDSVGYRASRALGRPVARWGKVKDHDLDERKKENRQPKGGMGGRYTATTQGF